MQSQSLILIILLPFIGALISGVISFKAPRSSLYLVIFFLSAALVSALYLLFNLNLSEGSVYSMGSWPRPVGIEFVANKFNLYLVLFVLLVAILNLLHSSAKLASLYPRGRHFYTLYLLLVTGFIGLSFSADVFNLYVFLEITSLTSYALIGRGDGRACRAAFNYLLIGTVGASFYLIGVGFLYLKTGTLSLYGLEGFILQNFNSATIQAAFTFIMLGLMMKMAIFPLHIWLPNAYSYCPQPSVGLLAPLSTKISIFLMFKIILDLFSLDYVRQFLNLQNLLINLSALGIVVLSILALAQKNWVRTFSYFIVIEIGYIFGGFWLLNSSGVIGATYHLFCDILLTLGVFLFIGTIRQHFQAFTANNLIGLFKKLPISGACFIFFGLTLIGIPLTPGFVSKMYLLIGAAEQHQWLFFISLLVASLSAAIIFFKMLEVAFFTLDQEEVSPIRHNSLSLMSAILVLVVLSLFLLGVFQINFIENVILSYV